MNEAVRDAARLKVAAMRPLIDRLADALADHRLPADANREEAKELAASVISETLFAFYVEPAK